jgi:hypothetical protein
MKQHSTDFKKYRHQTLEEIKAGLHKEIKAGLNKLSMNTNTITDSEEVSNPVNFTEYALKLCSTTTPPKIVETDSETRVEHYYDLGWYLHNKIFKEIPSEYHIENKFNFEIIDFLVENATLIHRKISENSIENEYSEIVQAFLYKETVIVLTYNYLSTDKSHIKGIHIYHSTNVNITEVLSDIKKFEQEVKTTPKIGIIKQTKYGPSVTWRPHEPLNEFSFDNYNEDFGGFLTNLTSNLKDTNNGLYLLYGEAGTGKSSAIRHLISTVNRPFVFIPPQMVNYLANPDFTDLVLTSLKNAVLIIEDAEKALMKRESEDAFHNSELVSTLLNLTDGLYADLAKTSIIATYNCDRNLIDPALLRRGRMKAEYKFNRLSIERTQALFDKLDYDENVSEPMTLADIFNHNKQYSNEEREQNKPKRTVGFGR